MMLTPHFDSMEFIRSFTAEDRGIDNSPSLENMTNLARVADVLEKIRTMLDNKPIQITSGFRCKELNDAVHGVPDSAHVQGLAADIICPAFGGVDQVYSRIAPHVMELGIDQLIHEHDTHGATWVHVGLSQGSPRNQCLTLEQN